MREYQLIEHVADVRLFVRATNLEELFMGALEGMASIIKPEFCSGEDTDIERIIAVYSGDETLLLIDFLSQVLTLSIINKAVFFRSTFALLTETRLEAKIAGKQILKFDEDIKAVTYHDAQVEGGPDGFYAVTITFDI